MTKAQETIVLNVTKEAIQEKFEKEFGFAPSKNQIIPLEASYSYDNGLDFYYCDSLGFRVGAIGYSYSIGKALEKAECYNA